MFRVRCFQPSWEVFAAKSDLDEELTVVKSEVHGGNPCVKSFEKIKIIKSNIGSPEIFKSEE